MERKTPISIQIYAFQTLSIYAINSPTVKIDFHTLIFFAIEGIHMSIIGTDTSTKYAIAKALNNSLLTVYYDY